MQILVTGGAGFIGTWLVKSLLADGHQVVIIDNLSPQIHGETVSEDITWLENQDGLSFIKADIRNEGALEEAMEGCEAIIHLAAETGTGQSMYQISHYYEVNVQATAKLFELAAKPTSSVKQVLLASSRSVYGEGAYDLAGNIYVPPSRTVTELAAQQWNPKGPNGELLKVIPTPETAMSRPASVYAASKLANEELGRIISEAYGLKVTALRFQNVYGEGQSLKNPYTGILSIFSNRMRQDQPINIYEDGEETRDFVHVSDVVSSIRTALQREGDLFEILNVGSGEATSVMQVATLLQEYLGSKSEIFISGDYRVGDIRHCYADLNRVRAVLRFEPSVTIQNGLQKFVQWVLSKDVEQDRSEQAYKLLGQLGLGRSAS